MTFLSAHIPHQQFTSSYKVTYDALDALAQQKTEIRKSNLTDDMTCFCYMLQDSHTFDSRDALECRGIVFNTSGEIVSRGLHKFFNLGEKTNLNWDTIPWDRIDSVMDKLDGSVISTVKSDGGYFFKSKKSVQSDVVIEVNKWYAGLDEKTRHNYDAMITTLVNENSTLIFEWTSPSSPIVIHYDKPTLSLLHIRRNDTGEYMSRRLVEAIAKIHKVPVVKSIPFDFSQPVEKIKEHFMDMVENSAGIEGVIFQLTNGDMIKLKTKWYLSLHHIVTFLRERDVAEAVLLDTIDDMKSAVALSNRSIARLEEIEKIVTQDIMGIEKTIKMIAEQEINESFKNIAQKHAGHEYFGLIMSYIRLTRSKNVSQLDYTEQIKEFYSKNVLKTRWSLDVIIF